MALPATHIGEQVRAVEPWELVELGHEGITPLDSELETLICRLAAVEATLSDDA